MLEFVESFIADLDVNEAAWMAIVQDRFNCGHQVGTILDEDGTVEENFEEEALLEMLPDFLGSSDPLLIDTLRRRILLPPHTQERVT